METAEIILLEENAKLFGKTLKFLTNISQETYAVLGGSKNKEDRSNSMTEKYIYFLLKQNEQEFYSLVQEVKNSKFSKLLTTDSKRQLEESTYIEGQPLKNVSVLFLTMLQYGAQILKDGDRPLTAPSKIAKSGAFFMLLPFLFNYYQQI